LVLIVLGDAKVIRAKERVGDGFGKAHIFGRDLSIAVRPDGAVVCSMEHDNLLWVGNSPTYQAFRRHEAADCCVPSGLFGVDVERLRATLCRPARGTRTLELSSREAGIEFRMIRFDDLDVILPGFPGPSPEMLTKMYGR
jgi:hypothetical protein